MAPKDRNRRITQVELAKEVAENGALWIVMEDNVYDVSSWMAKHPGGSFILQSMKGLDVTSSFHTTHAVSPVAMKVLPSLRVGTLVDGTKPDSLEKDFRSLTALLHREGFYETSFAYYWFTFARIMLLLGAAVWLVRSAAGSFWIEMVAASFLALFFQQIAFIGHDTGHNGITQTRWKDRFIGFVVGNLLTGISIGWWKDTHNTHHILTNSVDFDPDIQHLPVFAITTKHFANVWSHYHRRILSFDAASKILIRYQHILFFPIMGVARFNLYIQSWRFAFLKSDKPALEVFLLCAFAAWLWALVAQCTYPVTFIFFSHFLAGILHVQICVSHFALETYKGVEYTQGREDFFRRQLATSLDIVSTWANHWFYGGLDYQVEHHLFPRVPRHNLWQIKPHVMALCKKHGIEYQSIGWWESIRVTIQQMKEVAHLSKNKKLRMEETMLWHGLNAIG